MIAAPVDATWFQNVRPSDAGYVYSRRIIPLSPRTCMGPKVRLKPTSITQNWSLPSFSFSCRPKIFGHQ